MKIHGNLTVGQVGDLAFGQVLITQLGDDLVRGIKAYYLGEDGERHEFFVTVGPFVREHGHRPVVYLGEDVAESLAIDVTEHCQIKPSLLPQDISSEPPKGDDGVGMLLVGSNRSLLKAANFGRAGGAQVSYLNLESGELSDLPDDRFVALRRWSVEADADGGGQFDFSLA